MQSHMMIIFLIIDQVYSRINQILYFIHKIINIYTDKILWFI
jgi:hypothetical protein